MGRTPERQDVVEAMPYEQDVQHTLLPSCKSWPLFALHNGIDTELPRYRGTMKLTAQLSGAQYTKAINPVVSGSAR